MGKARLSKAIRRAVHPLSRHLNTTAHTLRHLFLEVTKKCDLKCIHCYNDCNDSPRTDELSTNQWLGFIDYLSKNFSKRNLFLEITGGEPLCREDLFDIFAKIKSAGFQYGMITNGFDLDQANITKAVDLGISNITVSLDGMEGSHERLRGVPGSFKRAVRSIELLSSSKIPSINVATCVYPGNLAELSYFLHLVRNAGVKRWRFFTMYPQGRAKQRPELILSNSQIRELIEWITATRTEFASSSFDIELGCEGYLPQVIDAGVRNDPYFCRSGINIGSVLSDGAITGCPNSLRSLVQGNIKNDDFKTVWTNGFDKFRNREWMKQGPCKTCVEWKKCLGSSLHLWDEEKNQPSRCHYTVFYMDDL